MNDTTPTFLIKTPSGPTRINQSDYDPKIHELVKSGEGDVTPPKKEEKDINGYFAQKHGSGKNAKFVIVDKDGKAIVRDGVDPKGYKTEGEAQAVMVGLPALTKSAIVETELTDGTKLSVDGDVVSYIAADGSVTAALDGEYAAKDGSKIVVKDGKIA